MRILWQDLRQGARLMRRNPGFAIIVTLILALGIGANTAIFSVVNSVLLRPLAYRQPEHLCVIRSIIPQIAKTYPSMPANVTGFRIWQREFDSFEQIAIADAGLRMGLTGMAAADEMQAARAYATLFEVLSIRPAIG